MHDGLPKNYCLSGRKKLTMDKSLCLYFQVHQPDRLRLYRFFDIGNDSHYYDDFANKAIMNRVAQRCYLPMNALLLELIEQYKGEFKVSFSITGGALEQFKEYAPEVLDSFKRLAKTGCVEFWRRPARTLWPLSNLNLNLCVRLRSRRSLL